MADAQQQRDQDVVTYESFSGLRNDVSAERFGLTDLALGDNVDLDNSGRISRRVGRVKHSNTATHSVWSDGGALAFCVQGALLQRIAADYSLSTVMTGLTASQRMSYAKVNDVVYLSNGRQSAAFDANGIRSWGLPVAPIPAVAVGTGNLPAGVYQFVVTYVRADGQEGGAQGTAGRVVVPGDNGAITFTLTPSTDPGVAFQDIYLTTPNGDILYHALRVAAAATSITYANNALELNYELKLQYLSAPPAGQLVGYYSGRAYVAADDGLYPSEPFAYELFDLRNYIPMNGRCTLIAPMEDKERLEAPGQNSGLFLGTDRTCGVLVGNDPNTFQYVPKTDYGAIEGALDFVDGSLFGDGATGARKLPMWLSTQGICVGMPGMEIRNLTRNKYSIVAGGRGAAVFDPKPNRFIALSNF